jgi:nitrite reductase/ring-hydroxylating ferredoxin subunit/alkylhydroperoxidase/carboxymuconolactone decarboxylase family protein YurZ
MSDALNYLVKVRPETMGHYFKFLKETGKHLDPKTRNLISVITKVHSQTERGLRQYLSRALREGCTPMEVLDALLMAFPALGLAKIIWATDIILSMNIPGFDPDSILGKPASWHDIAPTSAVAADKVLRFTADARSVFVYRSGRSYRVYDSRCPHQSTDINELAVKGKELTCPKHGWGFDVPSGDCIRKGNTPLTKLESRVSKGMLQALW